MKKCVLCGGREFERLFRAEGRWIEKCGRCGLVRTRAKGFGGYEEYHRDEAYLRSRALFRNIFEKRFKIVRRYKKRGRVLEIGCSTGEMLDIFGEDGWERWGVEPSGAGRLAEERGHKILRGEFEKANLPKGYFDAVVMNHTLEHMRDPVVVMKKVRRVLRKGGAVLVDVPNFDALSRELLGAKWPFLLPKEHVHHFTPGVMRRIFEEAGLETIHWESRSGIFECARPLSELALSLRALKKRFFTNIIGAPGAALVTALNRGASFSMVGRAL